MAVANIGNKDLLWSMLGVIFKLGSGILLFPFVLNRLPSETVGIWVVYTTIMGLSALLDFGFKPSFTRTVSYVFSGAKDLKVKGYDIVSDSTDGAVDFSLLKSTIKAMRFYYSRLALILLFLLLSIGTFYIYTLAQKFSGNVWEIYISWIILCTTSTYNLYTLYFDALLTGRGNVEQYNKYVLCGNAAYLVLAATLVMLDFGLIAIVASQLVSILIIRFLSYRYFYNDETKDKLNKSSDNAYKDVIKAIAPNAIKVGLTSFGGFIINKSALFIGSIYLTLEQTGAYGITIQLIAVVGSVAYVYNNVFMPKVYQWRLENNTIAIKAMYYRSALVLVLCFLSMGTVIFFCGNWILTLLGSKTQILGGAILLVMLVIQYLETNQYMATVYLMSKNEIPYFKASLITAACTLILLYVFVVRLDMQLWGMVLAQGLSQLAYQNWKWPLMVIKDLNNKDIII